MFKLDLLNCTLNIEALSKKGLIFMRPFFCFKQINIHLYNNKKINLMYSIFHVEGGIGKNILATSVIESLKKSDPEREIIVVTAWPAVWFNNPNISQIYPLGQVANFYKKFIKNQDVKVFRQDPYHTEDYILNRKHLINIWCDLIGVENKSQGPNLHFSPLELQSVQLKMLSGAQKPIFLLHSNGGGQSGRPYSWYRDIPIQNLQDIVEYFKNDYHIYQIGYENQLMIEGCHRLTLDTREILASVIFCRKRLLIDSFSQHAAAALGQKSVVCWVGNKPEVLGYASHINVVPNIEPKFDTLHSSYLDDADISGNPIQFPYDRLKIFDSNEIINKLIEL